MKIFVVVPSWNEGKRVVKTVRKVLKNTKNSVIVVDDGSSDNSFVLLKKILSALFCFA
ncbi:glycosyltransferase [Candidatus Parcubacteria bacterium]|nr:glycosyltransferase [Candidatus Parcubacteria bacterium]